MKNIHLSRFKNTQENLTIEKITSINKCNYDNLFIDEKRIFNFLSISNLFELNKLNSEELLEFISDFEKKLIKNQILIMNDDLEKLNTNRYLLNYLFSFRTYIDYIETFIKREYGKQSKEMENFKTLVAKLYDENFAYRFFYKLRNYAQHCGLPINLFEILPSINDEKYSVKIRIGFYTEGLLKDFDSWGEILKKELQEFETIDLISITQIFTSLIEEINVWFYSLIFPIIQMVKSEIETILKNKIENTLNFCVTYNDENDRLRIVDSVFRYIAQIEKNYR